MLESDFEYKEKVPTREERKREREQRAKDQKDLVRLKAICYKFVEEQLVPLSIPISTVIEAVPELVRTILSIHRAKSKKFEAYLKAKEDMELENICSIVYADKN